MRNGYDEAAAVAYARRWALLRNPAWIFTVWEGTAPILCRNACTRARA